MGHSPAIWGVHMGIHVGNRPIEESYVAIGWSEIGDIRLLQDDRDAFKIALAEHPDNIPSKAIPGAAGVLYRFAHVMKEGDIVIYPSKHDRMVNIGRLTGNLTHVADDVDDYPNRREVIWLGHFPRTEFSQSALNEIGSAITLFSVRRHASEFLSKVSLSKPSPAPTDKADDTGEEATDDDSAVSEASTRAEETTTDFVIRRVMTGLSGHEFENLVAHLLECMGYTARVTQRSGDGGVDVIAHMDALGFQPPIIKAQCKRSTSQTPRPDVDQLLGTLGDGEFGLFVNLGSYARGAVELERNRSKLRLIDGAGFVEMLLDNYERLSPRYRSLIPLRQVYLPDLPKP